MLMKFVPLRAAPAVCVVAVLALLSCADKKIEVDYNFGGVSSLLGVKKLVTTPSSTQSITASTQISPDAAVIRVQASSASASKTEPGNTLTSITSSSGGTASEQCTFRVTNQSNATFHAYYNGVERTGGSWGTWAGAFPITIVGGGNCGTVTFNNTNGPPTPTDGSNIDDTVTWSANGAVTVTSTPSITAGSDGQMLVVELATGSPNLTLQDDGTLVSSGLRLADTTVVLKNNDQLHLIYSSSAGAWVQVAPQRSRTTPANKGGTGFSDLSSYAYGVTYVNGAGTGFNFMTNTDNAVLTRLSAQPLWTVAGAAGTVLRSNGTNWAASAIQAGDVPTLNQNTTGTAGGLSGTPNITVGAATVSSLVSSGAVLGKPLMVDTGGSLVHAANRIMLEATAGWAELRLDGPDATTKGGFEIASYEADGGNVAAVFQISAAGINRMPIYGAGTATFDASGNISSVSDERVKHIRGAYTPGLEAVRKIKPIVYNWRPESHMETAGTYAGFSAQNVRDSLGDLAVGRNKDGMLTLNDRVILGAAVNAIDELASYSAPLALLTKHPDGSYSGPIVDEIRKPLLTRILSLETRLAALQGRTRPANNNALVQLLGRIYALEARSVALGGKTPAPAVKPTAKPKQKGKKAS